MRSMFRARPRRTSYREIGFQRSNKRSRRACSLWIESLNLVKLFEMKYATVRINDIELPSILEHYPRLRQAIVGLR
jgi:hypothetical protein